MPHPKFQRMGSDLLLETPISFTQAALGTDLEVPTLGGRARIRVPAGTQDWNIFRLKGKGMSRPQGIGSGNLNVKVKVKTPSSLTERQKQLLEALSAELGEKKKKWTRKEKSHIYRIMDEVKSADNGPLSSLQLGELAPGL